MTLKTCTKCAVEKPLTEFGLKGANLFTSRCRECNRRRAREYYAANPARYYARTNKWKQANIEKVRQRARERYAANPDKDNEKSKMRHRESCRKYNYKRFGMTVELYEAKLKEQNYCCEICHRHMSEFKKRLFIDHNHKTGQVRGLLCTTCNMLVGYAKKLYTEDGRMVLEYIERHGSLSFGTGDNQPSL